MIPTLKSKKIGVFSDIHIGLGLDSSTWHDIVLEFAKWVSEIYLKEGINDIIIPGDIFHNRNEISVNTLATATEFFDILKDFKIYILAGNHDCYYKDRSDVNSISLLKGWSNITIADKEPLLLKAGNKTISLIPWGTEIKDIPNTDICFGHFEIQTFYMNTFKKCDHGMESANLLNKAPLVISGHFHGKDERKYSKGKIVYVGSPYQQNFGDVDQIRGVYTLDLETEEFVFIENTVSPKHIKIPLSMLRSNKHEEGFIKNFLKTNVEKNMVSLVIDEEISNEKISLLNSKITALNPRFFRVDYKSINTEIKSDSDVEYTLIDFEKTLEDFINSLDIQHKEATILYLNHLYTKTTK